MIFRMLCGFALAWMLIPHEPDLGFGRPGFSKVAIERAVAHDLTAAARRLHGAG